MKTIRGAVSGGTITEHTNLLGQIRGSATVSRGMRLVVHGQVTENLTIEEGGVAEIRGMVVGDVTNRGRLLLHGTIVGALHDESGDSQIAVRSSVGG